MSPKLSIPELSQIPILFNVASAPKWNQETSKFCKRDVKTSAETKKKALRPHKNGSPKCYER